jgi:hypothetical protein
MQVSDLATGALEQMLASSETEASAAADLLSFDLVLLTMPEVVSTQALDPHAFNGIQTMGSHSTRACLHSSRSSSSLRLYGG